jgi:paraquat-inducible protein A
MVPALSPGASAQCARCPTILRRASTHRLEHIIALAATALVLLALMCASALMSVETAGIRHVADLFSGPEELVRQGMAPLAAVVLFVTVLAPFARLLGMLYVLIRAHERHPPRHLRRVFALSEKLRPWSMIEVFVLGVFVAYVKLGGLVEIGLRTGVYALLALTIVLVWVDAALDREKVWERLDHDDHPDARRPDARHCAGSADPIAAKPAAWSPPTRPLATRPSAPGNARVATVCCIPAGTTASSAPGPWSSPRRSSTSRPITIRC